MMFLALPFWNQVLLEEVQRHQASSWPLEVQAVVPLEGACFLFLGVLLGFRSCLEDLPDDFDCPMVRFREALDQVGLWNRLVHGKVHLQRLNAADFGAGSTCSRARMEEGWTAFAWDHDLGTLR